MEKDLNKAIKYANDTNRLENNDLEADEINEILDGMEKDEEEFVSSVSDIIKKEEKEDKDVKTR